MNTKLISVAVGAGAIGLLSIAVGCGGAQPSRELVHARQSYQVAEQSKAAQLAPDHLLTAKQALKKAEELNDDDPGSLEERTASYVAGRKARLAIAFANIKASQQTVADARRAYTDQLKSELADTRSALTKNQDELERERIARESAQQQANAALSSLENVARIKEEARGLVITLGGEVLFKSGSSKLMNSANQKLDQVATALKEQKTDKPIIIEGHTDSRGSDTANERLSKRRAEAVRAYLIAQGVPSERLTAVGKGEADAVADNATPEGRANNRRVEIVVPPIDKSQTTSR
jgi:outer membrane protein OmpA-like peptidoglycan-associated protein